MSSEPESVFDEAENDASEAREAMGEVDDVDEVGETSESAESAESESALAEPEPAPAAASRFERLSFLKTLTIYDAMLIASAASIFLACVLLVWELASFGGPFFQWRTSEALVEPLTPPQ